MNKGFRNVPYDLADAIRQFFRYSDRRPGELIFRKIPKNAEVRSSVYFRPALRLAKLIKAK